MTRTGRRLADTGDGTGEALAMVLSRAAAEARRQSEALSRLDAEVGVIAAGNLFRAGGALQETDLIRQEAEGLADFLAALAASVAAEIRCDPVTAAASLAIRAQAARLTGETGGSAARSEPQIDLWLD